MKWYIRRRTCSFLLCDLLSFLGDLFFSCSLLFRLRCLFLLSGVLVFLFPLLSLAGTFLPPSFLFLWMSSQVLTLNKWPHTVPRAYFRMWNLWDFCLAISTYNFGCTTHHWSMTYTTTPCCIDRLRSFFHAMTKMPTHYVSQFRMTNSQG